jgi:DNA-binding MarR family transcriptional regulator
MCDKQSSPCMCINVRRASLAITEVYDSFLAPSGLKISQYSLLNYARKLGPVSVSDLAAAMRLDRTTLVRSLKPLEEKGYIADTAVKGTRNRQLLLTDSGREVTEQAGGLWADAQNYLKKQLGKDDLETLTALLARVEALAP